MLFLMPLLFGLLLPAIVGGGIFVLAYRSARNQTKETDSLFSGWLVGVALGAGYIVGYIGLEGFPRSRHEKESIGSAILHSLGSSWGSFGVLRFSFSLMHRGGCRLL